MELKTKKNVLSFNRTKETYLSKISNQAGDFQRLICFQDGFVVKPPPMPFEFSDNHEGWKYWLDHVRGY